MKTNFKLLIGGFSLAVISITGYNRLQSYKTQKQIEAKREKHAEFLENSPYKETLTWDKKTRKHKGLPPNRYFEQMAELTMNPATGKLEQEKITKLREQLMSERTASRTPGDNNNAWVERGPNNIGGRTRVIMFDPNDATNRRVYAGGVSGGLWVNNNITSANSQWQRVQNVPGNLAVTSITVDPRDSNTWYVGTGEQYTGGDVVGNGVYRTTDGGTNWTAINIPAAGGGTINFNAANVFLSGIYYVNDILAWDNGTSTELFVAVGGFVYGSAASPANWLGLQSAGLYRSTNGGTTWNRIESANMRYDFSGSNYYFIPNDLEIGADNRIWMGTINSALGQGGGRVFSSTNGNTWTEAAASPLLESNRVEIEPSSNNANKLYVLAQGTTDASPVRIFETTNAFGTVRTLSLPNDADPGIPANDFTRGQAFYDLAIEADPSNDNIVYVGGIDLFRTTNGGTSWNQLSQWNLPNNVHADQHSIAFANNSSTRMLFGNDGGVYYSNNSGGTISARNRGYNVTQFVKAAIGPDGVGDTSGIFTAGAQDNGTQAFRNASAGINSSTELSDGDGFYTFVDKDGQYMISTFVNNVIYRFNLPWNGRGRRQGGATTLSRSQTTGDFVNQMDYDNDANRLLTNNSTRATATTAATNSILSINVAANSRGTLTDNLLTAKPTAFRASPFTANRWFIGLADGNLLRLSNVTNSSATFANITTPFVGSTSSVRFGATENDIFVTIHNYGVVSIWATNDGGVTWVNKEGDLPDIPVRDFLQNPLDRSEAIVATQLGVWSTSNFNATTPTWTQSYNGMSDVSVTSFDYWNVNGTNTENRIIASTYGRGVFTGQFTASPDNQSPSVPTNVVVSNITSNSLILSWNPSTDNIGVTGYDIYRGTTNIGTSTTTSFNVTGLTSNTGYSFTVRAKDAGGNESTASAIVSATTTANTTTCSSTISSFPYSQGFESGEGWTQVTGDDGNWLRDSNGTPSNNTGPSSATEGSFYMFLEASNNNSTGQIGSNATAILESPCFDLSGAASANFTFSNHMFGANVGTLTAQVSTDNSTWTNVWTDSGNQGNQWNDVTVNLDSYVGSTIAIRLVGRTGNGWSSDIAIDNLTITTGSGTDPVTPLNYCTSSGNRNSFEWIDNVALGGISNATGAGTSGYSDFTNQQGTLVRGTSTTMTLSAGFSGTAYTEFWAVWIDFNQNGTFENTERVTNTSSSSSANLTRTIAVPSSANLGQTRMRVSMKYNSAQTACENFADGEVEDYTINIVETTTTVANESSVFIENNQDEEPIKVSAYPNPATNFVQIKLNKKAITLSSYRIINTIGQTVQKGSLNEQRIEVSNLNVGMYMLEVNDGQKSFKTRLIKK